MSNGLTLSAKDRTMMKALGKAGDIFARAINNAISNDVNRATLLAAGTNLAAKSATAIHAAIAGNTSVVPVTTGITNPVVPKNLIITFQALWDGGNVVVAGTREGVAISETFLANAGSTRVGTKIFDTVTSVSHTAVGATANTYSVGDGDKIGIPSTTVPAASSPVLLFTNGVAEAVTFDATVNGFTPTTIPDGTKSYVLSFNQ